MPRVPFSKLGAMGTSKMETVLGDGEMKGVSRYPAQSLLPPLPLTGGSQSGVPLPSTSTPGKRKEAFLLSKAAGKIHSDNLYQSTSRAWYPEGSQPMFMKSQTAGGRTRASYGMFGPAGHLGLASAEG